MLSHLPCCLLALVAFIPQLSVAAPSRSSSHRSLALRNDYKPCSPDFFHDYGNNITTYGYVQFVNRGASSWNKKRGLTNAKMIDVTDCVTPGKVANTWDEYMSRPLRQFNQGPGGTLSWAAKRCQTFRIDNGDGIWSNKEANGTYSIQTYHTYNRKFLGDKNDHPFVSNIGWQMKDNGIVWNVLGYNKQDTQLWGFECPCDKTNAAQDAKDGWVARDCAIISNSKNGNRKCLSASDKDDSINAVDCADPGSNPRQLWNIVLLKQSDMNYGPGNDLLD